MLIYQGDIAAMSLDFWTRTSGTWVNVATVILGSTIGYLLRDRLPINMRLIITQAVGLVTLFIGGSMATRLSQVEAGPIPGVILGLTSLAIGGLLGEWWQIETGLASLGNWLKHRFSSEGHFTEGFVAASLLFCVGPMALLGSLNNGLNGDSTLLILKSAMDGLAAIALTNSFGIGVGFSVLVILPYQGGLSLLAGTLASQLPNPATSPTVLLITGIGGLMILGIGLELLDIARIRTASFLPALPLAIATYALADQFR